MNIEDIDIEKIKLGKPDVKKTVINGANAEMVYIRINYSLSEDKLTNLDIKLPMMTAPLGLKRHKDSGKSKLSMRFALAQPNRGEKMTDAEYEGVVETYNEERAKHESAYKKLSEIYIHIRKLLGQNLAEYKQVASLKCIKFLDPKPYICSNLSDWVYYGPSASTSEPTADPSYAPFFSTDITDFRGKISAKTGKPLTYHTKFTMQDEMNGTVEVPYSDLENIGLIGYPTINAGQVSCSGLGIRLVSTLKSFLIADVFESSIDAVSNQEFRKKIEEKPHVFSGAHSKLTKIREVAAENKLLVQDYEDKEITLAMPPNTSIPSSNPRSSNPRSLNPTNDEEHSNLEDFMRSEAEHTSVVIPAFTTPARREIR